MTTTTNAPDAVLERIRSGQRFLLTSHVNPDGDAIGSALGLSRLLTQMGKGTTIWMRDAPPRVYRNLPGAARIHVGTEAPRGFPDLFDAAIVLECPSLERCGLESSLADLPKINIDHHLGNTHYGVVNWVDASAPAVGEMVFRIARSLRLDLDADTADVLLLALSTDTGGFRFSNTTALAFDAAGDLVRAGATAERVAGWIYESQPEAAIRLLGEVLGSLELHADGRVATAWVRREMMDRVGAGPGDTEGLVDYPRSIAGVETAALFRELPAASDGDDPGGVKVSLRSRGSVNVERIARAHGGGGHANAAGFAVDEASREGLQGRIVDALRQALEADQALEVEAAGEANAEADG